MKYAGEYYEGSRERFILKELFEKVQENAERQNVEENISRLKLHTQALDEKLNKLLNVYLDGIVESETYKKKKNEIFTEKLPQSFGFVQTGLCHAPISRSQS